MNNSEKKILFLSLEDVVSCGGADVVKAAQDIETGFFQMVKDKVLQPFKTTLKAKNADHEHRAGLVNFLPSYVNLEHDEIYGCKALGAMPCNVKSGIPRATGLILLFDPATKTPMCVMDAQAISATRTGGVTLLAAKKVADPSTEEIGMVGAGVNMRTQLLGLKEALPSLRRVKVYSRNNTKKVFANEMSERTGLLIIPVEKPEEAVEGMSLIVTCLPNMDKPVVKDIWVKERGVTMINIGCYESETTILARMDRVIADIWQQGKHRGVQTHALAVAQGVIPEEKVEDLAPIITGSKPGRTSSDENIFFAPTGLGFEDAVVAHRVYHEAVKREAGIWLDLWKSPKWI